MKNIIFNLITYLYYFSLTTLIILYLFPGSLIGFFLYNDLGKQPNLVNNPAGTSINHFFYFAYLSTLGFISNIKKKFFLKSFTFIFYLSIILELSHILIPSRAFEYYDLLANGIGVIVILFLTKLFKHE